MENKDLFCSDCDWEGMYDDAEQDEDGSFVCPLCEAEAIEYED